MSATPFTVTARAGCGEIERIGLAMRLAARRIGKRNALDDDAMRPRRLRRRNQVARAFDADASVAGYGGRDPGRIGSLRQIGELMDDDRRAGAAPTAAVSAGASKTSTTIGTRPCLARSIIAVSETRGAGHLMPGLQQERHQSAADGARRARKEYSHRAYAKASHRPGRDRRRKAQMATLKQLRRDFFVRSVHDVAPELIGATLLFNGVGGVIVEVEAYHHTDPAAHSYGGMTKRNAVMFGPPGYAYVYRSYGIHWCVNFVCEPEGSASAVSDPRAASRRTGLPRCAAARR